MPWIPDEEMKMLQGLRAEVAVAKANYSANPSEYNEALLFETTDRRDRAIRELHNSGEGFTPRFIAAMLKVSKTTVREAIQNGEEASNRIDV